MPPAPDWKRALETGIQFTELRRSQAHRLASDLVAQEDHDSTESSHDLGKLLGQLPEKTRQMIECVKLEGLSVAETASRYGLSESNVKVSVHRGLRALAAAIVREGER